MIPGQNKLVSDWCESRFVELESNLNGSKGGAVHNLKKEAFEAFKEQGFPTPREEAWKYTNLKELASSDFGRATPSDFGSAEIVAPYLPDGLEAISMVFVNGFYDEALSKELSKAEKPKGVSIRPLSEVLKTDESELEGVMNELKASEGALVSFNTALFEEGAFIHVEAGVQVETPIQLVFLTTPDQEKALISPRFVIRAEEGASVQVLETWVGLGNGGCFSSPLGQIICGDKAKVEHTKLQMDSESALHLSTLHVTQGAECNVTTRVFSLGGGLVRNEIHPVLNGEFSDTVMNGLSVLGNKQHVDNYTVIDHAVPNCESNELFKGIYGGASRGVFSGTIIVRPDAQKTNAIQSNQSLLLSEDASIETRPQLKIWADDVKCTHGATIGQLDDEALFYLRARGLNEAQARQLLTRAFALDLVEDIELEPLREFILAKLHDRLDSLIS